MRTLRPYLWPGVGESCLRLPLYRYSLEEASSLEAFCEEERCARLFAF